MTHYVCPVCQGVANHPKVCETEGCENNGKDLQACQCTSEEHKVSNGEVEEK